MNRINNNLSFGSFLSWAAFACMEPLGMESGEITSEQITASSQYNPNWSPERSRLNYRENGWTPSHDNIKEWIEVSRVCWFQSVISGRSCPAIVVGFLTLSGGRRRERNKPTRVMHQNVPPLHGWHFLSSL